MDGKGERNDKMLKKMNLQLFSENETHEDKTQETKTYTSEELQAETDRKVSKALETQRSKIETEVKAQIETARKEAAELATMSEKEQALKIMEKKEKEIVEREKSLNLKLLTMQTKEDLINKNLPSEFAQMCVSETPEKTLENINTLETAWKVAIGKEVDSRIKANSGTPQGSHTNNNGAINPWATATFNLTEQGRLIKTDPDLANSLMATAI